MNARNVLRMLAEDQYSDGMNGETIGDRDAKALHAIDAWVIDIGNLLINAGHGDSGGEQCEECELVRRLRALGYSPEAPRD